MQKLLKLLGMAVLSLALLACGGDDDDDSDDTTTTTTAPPVDETDDADETDDDVDETDVEDDVDDESDEADDSDDAAPVGDVTAPDTELAVGDSAVVPYGDSMDGLIEITVTEIVAGDQAAFADAFGENAEGLEPFYIRYSVELLSIADDDRPDVPALRGVAPDGGTTGTVTVGSLPDCESERFGSDAAVGDIVETCRLQSARTGETVGGAEYDEHDDYSDNPVVWFA